MSPVPSMVTRCEAMGGGWRREEGRYRSDIGNADGSRAQPALIYCAAGAGPPYGHHGFR